MFYTYTQNNSGGSFRGPAIFVIIEADNTDEADRLAENNGLYFWGANHDGPDCPCCGDRWYHASEYKAAEVPSVYGEPIEEFMKKDKFWTGFGGGKIPYAITFFKDGTIKTL